MANNYRAIVDDIAAKMAVVANIGRIHGYERQVVDPAKFIQLFQDPITGRILGWEITRRSAQEHKRGAFFRHHQMVLQGYMGLQDASATGLTFQELCEEVCNAFRVADPATPGAAWNYLDGDDATAAPAQVESINDRMFGAVLCHCAVITLSVTERIIA